MLFKPLADAGDRAFVCVRRRVWSMKDTHLAEQHNRHAATLTLADLCPELAEERFNVLPLNICTRGVSEDNFERALMLPLHATHGTIDKYHSARRIF